MSITAKYEWSAQDKLYRNKQPVGEVRLCEPDGTEWTAIVMTPERAVWQLQGRFEKEKAASLCARVARKMWSGV